MRRARGRFEVLELLKEFFLRDRVEQLAIPVLDGGFTPNDRLEATEPIAGAPIVEPDDAVGAPDGSIYVSSGREIVRCCGERHAEREVVAVLPGDAGALGLASDGALLACVAGVGLARVEHGRAEVLLDAAGGTPLHCLTAVAVAPDGTVYVTDGSTAHEPRDWGWDLMEQNALGRLVAFEPRGGRATVLVSGLAYPHGVAVSRDGASVVFTQSWAHRVDRIPPSGAGALEPVMPRLAGYPARIHPAPGGGYWLSLFALRTHLVEFVLTQADFKREMMRTIDPAWWIRPALRTLHSGLEPLQGGSIKKLGITKPWAPPRSYGLVARITDDGEVVESLHSRAGGRRHGVVSARPQGGRVLLACKGGDAVLAFEGSVW